MTRAQPGASETAVRLRAQGHAPLVAPLLAVRRLEAPPGPPPEVGALAFTSANGVRAFAAAWTARGWPVFAVGDATARVAEAEGFTQVISANGDVDALAALIGASSAGGAVLHPCARERAGDLQGRLEALGCSVVTLPLYETIDVEPPPPDAVAALAGGRLDVVLLHSPKAARALSAWLAGRPASERRRLRAVALSPACAAPLSGRDLAAVEIAAQPTEAALLARLG